jgi:predicted DNA-binding protein (MmcQ/YjbR family)
MDIERLRKICLALPDANEKTTWNHPTFRAGTKGFVAFEIVGGRESIAFRVAPDEADLLLADKRFFQTPYGRGKWVSLWADGKVDWKLVAELARKSYRVVKPSGPADAPVRRAAKPR